MIKRVLFIIYILLCIPSQAQTLQLDSVYEVNVIDSAKTIVSWLLEHDNGFKGKEKSMNRIIQHVFDNLEIKGYSAKVLMPIGGGGAYASASMSPAIVSPQIISTTGGVSDAIVSGNIQIVDGEWSIYWEGLSYQKRPLVWVINGCYCLTTGYHKGWRQTHWKSFERYEKTDSLFCENVNLMGRIPPHIGIANFPKYANIISSIKMSDDIEPLHKYFISELSIFDAKPLIIYITTKS